MSRAAMCVTIGDSVDGGSDLNFPKREVRAVALKKKYNPDDPDNFFRMNQNIKPTA